VFSPFAVEEEGALAVDYGGEEGEVAGFFVHAVAVF